METKDLQELSAEIVHEIDKKYDVQRDAQLNISQLVEELGELTKVANLERLRDENPDQENLKDEFADVLLQLTALADLFDVDLEQATLDKIKTLKQRHEL